MPTYRNDTNHGIYWRHLSWGTAETKAVPLFVPHEALGLTKTSDEPYPPDPVAISQDLEFTAAGEQWVTPPAGLEDFVASFAALEGAAEVRCNSGANNPVRIDAGKGLDYVRRFRSDEVATFQVTTTGAAKVRVLIEREGL